MYLMCQPEANQSAVEQARGMYEKLTPLQRRMVELEFDPGLARKVSRSERIRMVAADFSVDGGLDKARLTHTPTKAEIPDFCGQVQRMMAEHERRCALKAEYVREYILSILELCPTDFFETDTDDGDWVICPERFSSLPREIKRLVQSVDVKVQPRSGRVVYRVNFISKESALKMAAQFTLAQKHEVITTNVPWDVIQGAKPVDIIERRLAAEAAKSTQM